ncbi:unnamed protein product [Prunus armeniaca]
MGVEHAEFVSGSTSSTQNLNCERDDALLVEPELLLENGSINANGRYQNAMSEEFECNLWFCAAPSLADNVLTGAYCGGSQLLQSGLLSIWTMEPGQNLCIDQQLSVRSITFSRCGCVLCLAKCWGSFSHANYSA